MPARALELLHQDPQLDGLRILRIRIELAADPRHAIGQPDQRTCTRECERAAIQIRERRIEEK